ncbi:putative disease resistance RPP13-like protein 1 [Prosopis cineraria]|uniref:putative disease resistance RPP13-like protein 1 n=1 Tax=Prosopis cineraria TaxID=364024 RepID=UPI00240EA336|nr:putative disease resistance RPP13-like protein 1 [Prosopis cineraria]XP_054814902.1 putative disease resistance RPP13-like protein 1 [Prosopis cineraria]XP_054814903.1 putative disease resistance RPP13-like protein 1 [Prosopis cineraria]XP_054814904.1 putative disease resistance RPP13-like protein 1 [Prosopis cineraria]XP_054814905.1 putative disease resistance RPP13-like protein 1 [Prosopis cineraria]XP_054814906.1 putative disease resistance RPP13-like protein 1 [Prosopis cineraria]XP_05
MAAELVGGAILSAFLQVAFDKVASRGVLDYFQKRGLNEALLEKLKIMLLSISGVIDDAEDEQFSNPNVKSWLCELKDAVYDAEDVLAEIDYNVSKGKLEAETQTTVTSKVRNFFGTAGSSFDKEIESRMKQVLENLEFLESRKIDLGLKQGKAGVVGSITKVQTTSLVDEAGTYGRDEDTEIIINWLLNDNHFLIISVVGMGGLGKTTLAQLVYNDRRVKSGFDLRVWVCVSDDFDVLRLTKIIFKRIMTCNDDAEDLDMLQNKLKEKLTGQKFLIVLDDVWCVDDKSWEDLRAPFIEGAPGSRILVTSRNKNVALAAPSDQIHYPHQLSDEDGWMLFTKYAFRNCYAQTNLVHLEEIGRRIVKKCQGLPLALKTIGSLLYKKLSWEEWNVILSSEIWNISCDNILPALILSYHHLPSHLKRCFAYCSLYPKDYEFNKEELVSLWMAQDFLQVSHLEMAIEEGGNECFQELVSRSFFQKSTIYNARFVMHDLLNDLANFVYGEFCSRQEDEGVLNISEKTRHLSFLVTRYNKFIQFEHLHKSRKLRTFMPLRYYLYFHWTWSNIMLDQLLKCKCLRFLSLCNNIDVVELPSSIRDLIHLRYLDLSGSGIKGLPDTICLLYNLQTLKLNNCEYLDELPSDLHKLRSLSHLDLQDNRLKKIPPKLGDLKNLQVYLTPFYVGKFTESSIKRLGELNLHGKLSIYRLQNVVHGMDALATNLKGKKYLEELSLLWSENDYKDSQNERNVLEKLQPHQNLKRLSINYYGGTRFPDWFADNTLSNIVSLSLKYCRYCFFLPSLGLLPSLKSLSIQGLDGIISMGVEFHGSTAVSFGSLELLKFEKMLNWEEWDCQTASRAFPCLKELHIRNCPKLKDKLPEQLPSLEILVIQECQELATLVPWAPMIQSLTLRKCGNLQLEYIPSTLKYLSFHGPCTNATLLEKIEHIIANTCIEVMDIGECLNLEFSWHQRHDSLRDIRVKRSCGSLRNLALDLFPALKLLCLKECDNLEMISVSEGGMHDPTSLEDLEIVDCPKIVSFWEGGFSAPKLRNCTLKRLGNLKSLPGRMNIFAPSLNSLIISDCPKMESF